MARPSEAADVHALRDLAERVARDAGRLVATGRAGGVEVAATKSSPVDVVTALDTASEQLVRESLEAARPQDAILGEELGRRPGRSGLTWVVDPIDGTVNFLYGIPAYAVSIAVGTGDPTVPGSWTGLAACVHAPAQGRTYTAARGAGAWREDEAGRTRLRVNEAVPLSRALVGTGFGYRAQRRAAQGRVVAALLPRVRDIRRAGCASLDLCAVAAGELDAYYERGLQPWDLAGGELVAIEAGAAVTGLAGESAGEELTLAGAPSVVEELAALLAPLGADRDDEPGVVTAAWGVRGRP
jgi:myo-inositol-1(or 4)-monophosphatase